MKVADKAKYISNWITSSKMQLNIAKFQMPAAVVGGHAIYMDSFVPPLHKEVEVQVIHAVMVTGN